MDKISKALKKLSAKEREAVKFILERLISGEAPTLDVKKLRGRKDIFRIRKGRVRVIYRRDNTNRIFVLAIEKRSEDTYK